MLRGLLILVALSAVTLSPNVHAQDDNDLWAKNFQPNGVSGTVKAINRWGDSLVVAGEINGLRITGAISSGLVFFNPFRRTWHLLEGDQIPLGQEVRAVEELPNGDLVVGGNFSFTSNGFTLDNIAVYRKDGTWSTLSGDTSDLCDGPVNALLEHDGRLYIGGEFFSIGPVDTIFTILFAGWDPSTGFFGPTDAPVAFPFDPEVMSTVHALEHVPGDLSDYIYIGGNFVRTPGDTLGNIAAYSISQNIVTSVPDGGTNGPIYALEHIDLSAYETEVYMGGEFTIAGTAAVKNCAMFDLEDDSWNALGDGFDGPVYAAEQFRSGFGPIQFAGAIDTLGGDTPGSIRLWNFVSDSWLESDVTTDGPIYALYDLSDFSTVVGGDFEFVGDSSLFYGVFEYTQAGTSNDSVLYPLGDALELYDGPAAQAYDVDVDDEGNFYVIGSFTHAGGAFAKGVAKWDGGQWHALGEGLASSGPALAVNGDTVYVARFSNGSHEFLMWDGATWTSLSAELPLTHVNEMAIDTLGHLYVAGRNLDTVGLAVETGLIRWDGTQWSDVGGTMAAGQSTPLVEDIYIDSLTNDVYICGRFTAIGGMPLKNVAVWNGSTWRNLGSLKTAEGAPRVIERSPEGPIVITGALDRPEFVQQYQDSAWIAYAGGIATWIITDLLTVGCDLYIAGDPLQALGTEEDPVSVDGVAKWNGLEWDTLGSAINSREVFALAAHGNQLAVAGDFSRAGGQYARGFSIWNGVTPAGGGGDLTLLTPVANDTLEYGTAFDFTWDDTLTTAEEVSIEVSLDSGATWQIIHNKQPARFGRLPWVVPDTNAPFCMVRYSDANALCGAVVAPFTFAITSDPDLESWWLTHAGGTYYDEPFLPGYTGFSWSNARENAWPDSIWKNIDYSDFPNPPDTAKNFPDWFNYCEAFGEDWCYPFGDRDRLWPSAVTHWASLLKKWGGSCLGFSKASLLWLYGNEFNTNLIVPYEPLYYLDYNMFTLNAVNRHWIYQFGDKHMDQNAEASSLSPYETMDLIRQNLEADYPRTLSFTWRSWKNKFDKDSVLIDSVWRSSSHNVVPYHIRNVPDSQGIYYIYYYDSNDPASRNRWMRIDSANATWRGSHYFTTDTTSRFMPRLPINEYMGLATDARKTGGLRQPLASQYIQVFTSATEEILISDTLGNQMGWVNNQEVMNGLAGGPIFPDDPDYDYDYPSGFLVPKGTDYRVSLSQFEGDQTRFTWFSDSIVYVYERDSTTLTQSDNLVIGEGISIVNTSGLKEHVSLATIQRTDSTERYVAISDMTFSPIDSMQMTMDSTGAVTIFNTGINRAYRLLLWNTDVSLPEDEIRQSLGYTTLFAGTTHKIVPEWGMLESEAPVLLIDTDQDGDFDDTTVIAITTSVEDDDPTVPRTYSLSQNYPNPFNPTTTIEFSLSQRSDVRIDVYNILGRRVATLLNTEMPAGSHSVDWHGTNDQGGQVSSGIYFYRMVADGYSASRKMLLLK